MSKFQIYNYQFGRIEKHDRQTDLFGEQETVMTANQELSSIRDWLSDDIYLYDAEKHWLTVVPAEENFQAGESEL